VIVGRVDAPATAEFRPGGKDHPIDRLVDDGEAVTFGGTTLTAHIMPGHTKGLSCLDRRTLKKTARRITRLSNAALMAGPSVPSNQYPGIVEGFPGDI
jgi:metallo-beta-lactamase class B